MTTPDDQAATIALDALVETLKCKGQYYPSERYAGYEIDERFIPDEDCQKAAATIAELRERLKSAEAGRTATAESAARWHFERGQQFARATAAERALVERDAQVARLYSTLEYVRQSILKYWPNSHPPTDLYRACKVAGDALAAVSVPALAAADVLTTVAALDWTVTVKALRKYGEHSRAKVIEQQIIPAVAKWREGK